MNDSGPNDWIDPAAPATPSPSHGTGTNDWVDPSGRSAPEGGSSASEAFGYAMPQAIPWGKELGAAIESGESYLPKWARAPGDAPVEQTGEGWSQRYAENLARIKGRAADLAQAHPYATVAGKTAPMLFTPGGVGGIAALGAGQGAYEGWEEGDSPLGMASKAALGAGTAYVGGKAAEAVLPAAGQAARSAVLDAAKRLGVTMPRYSVGLPITQQAGKIGFSVPGASTPLREATTESIEGLGESAEQAAAGATKQTAGQSVGQGIKDWIGPVSKAEVDAKYNAVANAMMPNVKTPLSATTSVANQIIARRQAAGLSGSGGAVDHVTQAIQRGNGLTYNGIKDLRSSVGEMLDSSVLPANMSKAELKQIYGSLSTDLERAAYNAGGQRGVAAHLAANDFAAQTAAKREQLVKLLGGPQAGNSDEAVFGAVQRAASTGNSADIALLKQARQAVSPQSWDELSRGVVSTLGRDGDGNFSPSRFLTGYGKISDAAKDELFAQGGQLRQNLDDLATVSRQWKSLEHYANPSGTAGHAAGIGMAVHAARHPLEVLATFLGAKAVGKFLANPAGAGAAANWVRATRGALENQTVKDAATRVAATAGAQLGAKVDPMALAAMIYHHYTPEEPDQGGGNVPQ